MFKFDKNSNEPRREQFWNKFKIWMPSSYATSMVITTALYQVNLVSDHTVANTSLTILYIQTGLLVLAAAGTTAARNFRPDFDTWWTESPQYRTFDAQFPIMYEEQPMQPMI